MTLYHGFDQNQSGFREYGWRYIENFSDRHGAINRHFASPAIPIPIAEYIPPAVDETTPRATFRTGFYEVLNDALGSEIEVVKYRPPEGVSGRAVVLSIVSGSNQRPGFGLRTSATQKGLMERFRIQIDIFETDREQAEICADKVEQAIFLALDTLRSTYGIFDVQKVVDTDTGPTEQLQREAHSILDYEGLVITDKTDAT